MGKLYNSELGVYFVDRNRTAFEHILQYMASDKKLYQVYISLILFIDYFILFLQLSNK